MKKNIGRALLMSFLSLFLCVTMLLGTTFAWFTDEVTSTNNIIKSGTLDVDLEYKNSVTTDWKGVDADTNVFLSNLWEPGHTEVVKLKVTNLGDLALKYNLGINIADEVKSVSINGTPLKLSEHIMFGIYEGDLNAERDAAIEAVKANATALSEKATKFGTIVNQNDSVVYTLVVYMPTTVGNEANAAVDAAKPTINLGINLLATQLVAESDSFDNKYDEDAEILPPAWDGEGDDLPAEVDDVITINTAGELKAFADAVNGTAADTVSLMATATGTSFSGKTVKLGADINLNGIEWTPIGAANTPAYFQGTFDGQGHTIYGLNVDNSTDGYMYSTSGLFGWIDAGAATIKNLTISGATVKGSHWVGGVAGYMTGTIENCHVTNSTITGYNVNDNANGDKIGGIVGCLNSNSSVIGNSVTNTTIIGNRDIGGIAGSIAANGKATNNKVANLVIIYETEKSYASAGEIVSGRTGFVADDTNVASEVTIVKGTSPAEGVIETAANKYEVTSKEGLLNVSDIIASSSTSEGRGIKVTLGCDIDLAGVEWKPIDKMWIDFDGDGHTIKNLKAEAWKAGLFGYVGGGSIKNLTLENVDITGAQAGAFAGAIEGTIENCVLKGNNKITWVEKHQFDDPNANIEDWSGIGAITGITQPCTVNATIAEGATVELNYGAIKTEAPYDDEFTGYIGKNKGTVVNNGTVTVIKLVTTTTEAQDALDKAKEGSIIALAAGDYGTLTVKNFWGGNYTTTDVNPITIKGGEGVNVAAIDLNGMNFVNIEGITFDAAKAIEVYAGSASGDYGNIVDSANDESKSRGANHITVKDCTFTGTPAVEVSKYCPINFMGSNPSSWTYNITVSGCDFLVNAQNFIRMNNVTNNGKVVIENNTFGGEDFVTNHHAINASANGGDWEIKGNTFINWNPKKCAFATGRSTADGKTDFVITGNTFSNTRIPTAADGDDGIIEIKTNSYTIDNYTLVFEGNTFAGALAGLDETTIKYVKP